MKRTLCALAGTALGGYCAFAAFQNGMKMSPDSLVDAYALGAAGAAAVVYGWVALPLARDTAEAGQKMAAWGLRLSYVAALVFVLMNAIGYTAEHAASKTGFNTTIITAYDEAAKSLDTARKEFELAQTNPRWLATQGCTNATAEKSVTFCGTISVIRANIATFQNTVNKGRPVSADAQAENLAFWVSLPPELVAKLRPGLWAIIIELICTACWYGALNGTRRKVEVAPEVVTEVAPEVVTEVAQAAPEAVVDLTGYTLAAAQAEAALVLLDEARKALYLDMMAVSLIEVEPVVPAAVDLTDYIAAAIEASAAVALLGEARRALAEVGAAVVAEPVVKEVVEAAPVVTKPAVKATRVVKAASPRDAQGRLRDSVGRFAAKAKLASVEAAPVKKPKLNAVPLNGSKNVVIFSGGKKNDK